MRHQLHNRPAGWPAAAVLTCFLSVSLGVAPVVEAKAHKRTAHRTSTHRTAAIVKAPPAKVAAIKSRPDAKVAAPGLAVPALRKPAVPSPVASPAANREEAVELQAPRPDEAIALVPRMRLPGGSNKVSLMLRGQPVQEVLEQISDLAKLNLVIDPSVDGTVYSNFEDVPLDTILETVLSTNGLTIQKVGSSFIVYKTNRFGQALIKFVPVHFVTASDLADKITTIVGAGGLSASSGGGAAAASGPSGFSPTYKLIADARTNTLIVHGTQDDIQLVERLAKRFDILMPSRVFKLTYLTPMEAVSLLKNSFFVGAGTGNNGVQVSGGGAGAAGGGAAGGGGKATGGGSSGGLTVNEIDFDKGGKTSVDAGVTEATPRFVPLERENNLMVIGSKEELNLVEQILPRIDKRRRQVLLRTQIVELTEDGTRQMGLVLQGGMAGVGDISTKGGLTINTSVPFAPSGPPSIQAALQAVLSQSKGKMLASPAVLAMDGRTSKIDTTQQVLVGFKTETVGIGQSAQTIQTPILDTVGVTFEITPRILRDSSVALAVHPNISIPTPGFNLPGSNATSTLKRTRDYSSQEVRVKDGQTLVLGGMMQEVTNLGDSRVPVLGDLPIIGAFFRQTTRTTSTSEVQIYITPEIQPDV